MPKEKILEEKPDFSANVKDREITAEIQQSYLDYAMSVIVSRALPDVRDGLKPVHRRILYSMWQSGLRASAKFRKSATVVGEVLGKYHPHGDVAVYDSMVRMAQDFSLRYPMVKGQGNFGSMDGDGAAAYRYTEAKLSQMAEEMLFDIEKDTVDFVPNFDGQHKEPTVLPAGLPQLLLNGSMGIAVGMATNIPPHNLTELIDGINHLIENPEASIEDLCEFVKGPDFPTGGIIYNKKDIVEAYKTGRGKILTRSKADIVETKTGMFQIVITEITYATNKSTLIEKIADLVLGKIDDSSKMKSFLKKIILAVLQQDRARTKVAIGVSMSLSDLFLQKIRDDDNTYAAARIAEEEKSDYASEKEIQEEKDKIKKLFDQKKQNVLADSRNNDPVVILLRGQLDSLYDQAYRNLNIEKSNGLSINQQLVSRVKSSRFIVEVGKTLGALGVRFLQVMGQYFTISPEMQEDFQAVYDNVSPLFMVNLFQSSDKAIETMEAEMRGIQDGSRLILLQTQLADVQSEFQNTRFV